MNGGIYSRWFSGLKGGQMIGWALGVAWAAYRFCMDNQIPRDRSLIVAGVVAFLACLLYFLNPKALEWVPPGVKVVDTWADTPTDAERYQVVSVAPVPIEPAPKIEPTRAPSPGDLP